MAKSQDEKKRKRDNASSTDASANSKQPKAPKQGTSIPMSTLAQTKSHTEYSTQDYEYLAENENYRYAKNSDRIAHAVIAKQADGKKIASQYAFPPTINPNVPEVCELNDIEEIVRFGMIRHQAKGADGSKWYAKRYDHARVKLNEEEDAQSVDFAYFSEEEKPGKEPFWGSKLEVPRFKKNLSVEAQKELDAETAEIGTATKGGRDMMVDRESVEYRDLNNKRNPDQNTLMGESARDAYEHFFGARVEDLSPELNKILQRAFTADLHKAPENQYRPEWLHAYGFSLTPATENPQRADNLGAAGKWANTEMMILERVAKWFALNEPNTTITINSLFKMFLDSELIEKIHFEVNIEMQSRFVRLIQDLDAFKNYPVFRKASDLAQATGITFAMLNHQEPISAKVVSGAYLKATSSSSNSSSSAAKPLTTKPLGQSKASENYPVVTAPGEKTMPKSQFPTHFNQEHSVVQLLVTNHQPDYEEPWHGTHISACSGSGFVVEHEGEKYILTNAHVVENHVRIQIRLANSNKKFDASPVCISYQADMALLKVKSKTFQKMMQPVELGEMVELHQEIVTIGFPMGGDEISITKGIVSRIEVGNYAQSGCDMLQVQVDSAINPGNSGGPVFSDNKVIGIAFQGMDVGQNLGYIIPIPIVKHFLQEVFNGKPYHGFPVLPVVMETLENKWQRNFYGMEKSQTGVIIRRTAILGDAHAKLKNEDILLEIEGCKISNEGTVDIPGVGKCVSFIHLTHMKFVGEYVHLKILRKDATTNNSKIIELDVKMEHIPGELDVVPSSENDKKPTYYINSGLVFVPVTRNYLDGPGSELDEVTFLHPEFGAYNINEMPKKNSEQQLVAINTVLDCKTTTGYEGSAAQIVNKANGIIINNFNDLINAMESNKNEVHLLEIGNKKVIVLKNLSDSEHAKVLRTHKIEFDRSEDLRHDANLMEIESCSDHSSSSDSSPSESEDDDLTVLSEELPVQKHSSSATAKPVSHSSAATSSGNNKSKATSASTSTKKRKLTILESESDSESEAESETILTSKLKGTDGLTSGQRRFMSRVNAMETHYKKASKQDETTIDWDRLTDDDEENDDDSIEAPKKSARATRSQHSHAAHEAHAQPKLHLLKCGHGLFQQGQHHQKLEQQHHETHTKPKHSHGLFHQKRQHQKESHPETPHVQMHHK